MTVGREIKTTTANTRIGSMVRPPRRARQHFTSKALMVCWRERFLDVKGAAHPQLLRDSRAADPRPQLGLRARLADRADGAPLLAPDPSPHLLGALQAGAPRPCDVDRGGAAGSARQARLLHHRARRARAGRLAGGP